ncbi:MAG: TPM domain-containing protein [Bradymonadales bacterium]|nr:TPM domain-containing protein [Bradymonadales bacterium]
MRTAVSLGLVVVALLAAIAVVGLPTIDRPVVDEAGVLTDEEEERITAAIIDHRRSTGVQIAVVLVPSTLPQPIEDLALELAESWDGGSRGQDDGILFLLAVQDQQVRLELGYGIEPYIPDAEARRILESGRDAFRAGEHGPGVLRVVEGIIARTAEIRPAERSDSTSGSGFRTKYLVIAVLGVGIGLLLWHLARRKAGQRNHPDRTPPRGDSP